MWPGNLTYLNVIQFSNSDNLTSSTKMEMHPKESEQSLTSYLTVWYLTWPPQYLISNNSIGKPFTFDPLFAHTICIQNCLRCDAD